MIAMPNISQMIGCWQVKGFVNPDNPDETVNPRNPVPDSLQGLVKRGEVLKITATENERVLWAFYVHEKSTQFWLLKHSKPEQVVLKAQGETQFGGSYKLLRFDTASNSLYWVSQRHESVEDRHVIRWDRYVNHTAISIQAQRAKPPAVPSHLLRKFRGHKITCICGDPHDDHASCDEFVTVSRANKSLRALERDLDSSHSRTRDSARKKVARIRAHFEPWSAMASESNPFQVHVCHMHEFARRAWMVVKKSRPKAQFKTFSLPLGQVKAHVKPEAIEAHYYLCDDDNIYVPKLNVQTFQRQLRSDRATEQRVIQDGEHMVQDSTGKRDRVTGEVEVDAVRRQLFQDDSALDGETVNAKHLPGITEIERLHAEVRQLKERNEALVAKLNDLTSTTVPPRLPPRPRYRIFFTKEGHCKYQQRDWSLNQWFGMTNEWSAFVCFVKSFHCDFGDGGLQETHSIDESSKPLTDFECCLLAKA